MKKFTIKAMVHSINDLDSVIIERHDNCIIAEYKGKKYTAIFNPFTCLYYVDDKFDEIK